MLHVYNPNTGWHMVLEGINRLQHHRVVRVYNYTPGPQFNSAITTLVIALNCAFKDVAQPPGNGIVSAFMTTY